MTRLAPDRLGRAIQVVRFAGFLVETTTHLLDPIAGGVETYDGLPAGLRAFWVSLTILDPLTVLLLLFRKRVGPVLGVVVILADITANCTVFLTFGGSVLFGIVNQTVFAAFLLITAPALWRWFRADHA